MHYKLGRSSAGERFPQTLVAEHYVFVCGSFHWSPAGSIN
jgi:hypothetical protein